MVVNGQDEEERTSHWFQVLSLFKIRGITWCTCLKHIFLGIVQLQIQNLKEKFLIKTNWTFLNTFKFEKNSSSCLERVLFEFKHWGSLQGPEDIMKMGAWNGGRHRLLGWGNHGNLKLRYHTQIFKMVTENDLKVSQWTQY